MPDWIKEILLGPSYMLGNGIWDMVMSLIYGVVKTTPQGFSPAAWAHTVTIYNGVKAFSLILMNLFFLVGFFRQASNIRENVTWEILIEHLIKALAANVFIASGLTLIREFFQVAADMSGVVLTSSPISFAPMDIDAGMWLFFFIFGTFYVIVAIVCSFIMLFAVYGRYLKLYVATVIAPLALSTWAGGRGIENTASSWIRYFLANVFEIFIIAIIMSIGGKMIGSIQFGVLDSAIGGGIDGMHLALQSMFTMILIAGAVKGADGVMRRAFGL